MQRRAFLIMAPALPGCAMLPVLPPRPDAAAPDAAASWVAVTADGRFMLRAPRQEMGQGVLAALRALVAAELGVAPDALLVELPDTAAMRPVRATVGSESLQLFAEPLRKAAAALRIAMANPPTQPIVLSAAQVAAASPRAWPNAVPPAPEQARVLRGVPSFTADAPPADILFGAMLRPPRLGARLRGAVPGEGHVAFVMRDGQAGLVAARPRALARALAGTHAEWQGGSDWSAGELARAVDVDARLAARGGASLPHRLADARMELATRWDIDLRIDIPMAAHAAIEPRAAIAQWRADGRALTIWCGTQDAFFVRAAIARRFGLAEDAVRVVSRRMGGAFGGRSVPLVELEAAFLARAVAPRPVLVEWSRAEEFTQGFHRPPSAHRIRARLGPDGRVAAWWHAFSSGHVIFSGAALPPWLQRAANAVTGDAGIARGALPPYAFGATRVEFDAVQLPVPTGPWRGLGAGPNAVAMEAAMDALAARAGQDPLAFRLAHLGAQPRLAACLRRAADMAGWGRALPPGRALGLACAPYKDASWAAVVVEADATRLHGIWCAQDSGRVVDADRVHAQVEGNLVWGIGMAMTERLGLVNGAVAERDFAAYRLPSLIDVPPVLRVELLPGEGLGGAGETALGPAAAAVVNALARARGAAVTQLPA